MADVVEKSKPLDQRWLGLGSLSAYKPAIEDGLMTWHDGRVPPQRCMGWLVLTKKGIATLRDHESEFKDVLNAMKINGYGRTLYAHYMLMGGVSGR